EPLERVPWLVERADDVASRGDGPFHAAEQRPAFEPDWDELRNRDTAFGDHVLGALLVDFVHDRQAPRFELTRRNFTRDADAISARFVDDASFVRLRAAPLAPSLRLSRFHDHGVMTMVTRSRSKHHPLPHLLEKPPACLPGIVGRKTWR